MLAQPCKEKVGPGQGRGLENYPNACLQNSKYSKGKSTHKKGRDFKIHGQPLKVLAFLEKMIDSLVFLKAQK